MPTNPSTPRNNQSIKLSVTVKFRLEAKYNQANLQQINDAVKRWIEADAKRGIRTLHVEVDNSEDETMKKLKVKPVSSKATAMEIKRAIKDLWNKFRPEPDYLVLFGSEDIVPMFQIPNPSIRMRGLDPDAKVPSDNPYATHLPYSFKKPTSYVVPERAIGRIPDMVCDPDPAWLLDYLDTATKWEPRDATVYSPYTICTAEAEEAANEFMQKAFGKSDPAPIVCPPYSDSDVSNPDRKWLSAGLHIVKCHGNKADATFWGFGEFDERKDKPCPAITSATLRALPTSPPLAATMCCYGAQIFSPSKGSSPGEWPVASTYLRNGALGFIGSTMMAWVGIWDMGPADWIVQSYLKNVFAGHSIGNAFLASKQDYRSFYALEGNTLSDDEEKTLIEYILLGDPSIHPVSSSQSAADLLAVQSRRRRRDARATLAKGIRDCLPTRSPATHAEKGMAKDVFIRAKNALTENDRKRLQKFRIEPTDVAVKRVDAPLPNSSETRQSLEFYWTGKLDRGGHKQAYMLKAETDLHGNLVPGRTAMTYTS
jgi:hypothetical protein